MHSNFKFIGVHKQKMNIKKANFIEKKEMERAGGREREERVWKFSGMTS